LNDLSHVLPSTLDYFASITNDGAINERIAMSESPGPAFVDRAGLDIERVADENDYRHNGERENGDN
jgi:hypothetical protein